MYRIIFEYEAKAYIPLILLRGRKWKKGNAYSRFKVKTREDGLGEGLN